MISRSNKSILEYPKKRVLTANDYKHGLFVVQYHGITRFSLLIQSYAWIVETQSR